MAPPAPKYSQEQQEDMILCAAQTCIDESSLLDFKMSAISKQSCLSMGSVYKHMQTKEDVLVGLGIRMLANVLQIFTQVLALPITTPEKLIAIHMLCPRKLYLYSFGVYLSMLIGNEAVLARSSKRWVEELVSIGSEIDALFARTIAAAISNGELNVPEQDRESLVEEIQIVHWSVNVGYLQATYQRYSRNVVGHKHKLPFPLAIDSPYTRGAIKQINTYAWKKPLDHAGVLKVSELLEQQGLR